MAHPGPPDAALNEPEFDLVAPRAQGCPTGDPCDADDGDGATEVAHPEMGTLF